MSGVAGSDPPAAEWPVDLRVRFERFPATVKGAFVMKGADGNPHGVRMHWAGIARVPGGPAGDIATGPVVVDVAPGRDLFIPFETTISDLDPGWYSIRCRIQVDGGRSYEYSSRGFCVPWPRSDVRRGTARLNRIVRAGQAAFRIDRVELAPDSAAVVWRAEGGTPSTGADEAEAERGALLSAAEARMMADGTPLAPLPSSLGPPQPAHSPARERRTTFYPVLRANRMLQVAVGLESGPESEWVDVPLE